MQMLHRSISTGAGWRRSSTSFASSSRDSKASRRGGIASAALAVAASQSVHSRRTAMLPRVGSRRISVSVPQTRRVLRTGKRCPFSGWKGWRTSAHPNCSLGIWVVRADRRDPQRPLPPVRFKYVLASAGLCSIRAPVDSCMQIHKIIL
jgi:hypothetical protein